MSNAELFKKVFGIYAEEFWAYPKKRMLDWLTSNVPDKNVGDMISGQAAIDAIDVLKRNYPSSCFEDLCKAVDIAIKALSAQPEPRWIPVSEPPEDEQIVWVTIKHGYTPAVVKRGFWDTEDKRWCDGDFGFPLVDQPIAWMPIEFPKPYERSEE